MKIRNFVLFEVACAVAIAGLTAYVIAEQRPQPEVKRVVTLRTSRDLCIGEPVSVGEFVQLEPPDEPKGAIRYSDELKGKRLRRPLDGGQFVTPDDLMTDAEWMEQRGELRAVVLKNVWVDPYGTMHRRGIVLSPDSLVDIIAD